MATSDKEQKDSQGFHVSQNNRELNPLFVTLSIIYCSTLIRIPDKIFNLLNSPLQQEVNRAKDIIEKDPVAIGHRKALDDVIINLDIQNIQYILREN